MKPNFMFNPIVIFLNYLNIYFLGNELQFRQWCSLSGLTDVIDCLEKRKENEKLPEEISKLFLTYFLKNSLEEEVNLYYAIMDENANLATQWADCLPRPPGVHWIVFPKNLKNILSNLKNLKKEKIEKLKTYQDKEWQFTNLEELKNG